MAKRDEPVEYDHPAGGWGSLRGIVDTFAREQSSAAAIKSLMRQNKSKGFACVSCAWTKPAKHRPLEFCENGAKATLWELTTRRCTPDFFAEHTVSELASWTDFDLEQQGRLTHPMRYNPATDKYEECEWDEAFAAVGRELRALDPECTVFYASGRASLETSYCYALFARLYGHNNLPDSSNMCHETTSVTLKKVIGVPVGTVVFDDFEKCDAIFFFGQNTGANSPRFLHPLQDAVRRGCKVVTFNPVRERGLIEMIDPQSPLEMLTGASTQISCQFHQVKAGGDIAVLLGLCKGVLERDDDAKQDSRSIVDRAFIAEHTNGFKAFEAKIRTTSWDEIEAASGLTRDAIAEAAEVYCAASNVIGIYGMGLTQHVHGFESIATFVNLLLMRGNIGREGAGISPVRGHSNVQGQRTVGISEKPELVPLDRLAEMFAFEPPRKKGMNTVEACEGILEGKVKAFIGLGGNFVRAVPETEAMEASWRKMRLTVQIATKLNHSHLVNGEVAYLLPCLGRTELDIQATGEQTVTVEDSLSHIHGSIGRHPPASDALLSEMAIVAGIAKETLAPNPRVLWDEWVGDYSLLRDLIEKTYPDQFGDFNNRLFEPGGFYRGNTARDRVWKTESGKAEFTVPEHLSATGFEETDGRLRLITLRSNDQFNTTIYGMSDRLRGIEGSRNVLLINPKDIDRLGLAAGQEITLASDAEDKIERPVAGLKVTPFDLPDGCVAGYYPELNPLIALSHHEVHSKTPAYKSVPVRIAT